MSDFRWIFALLSLIIMLPSTAFAAVHMYTGKVTLLGVKGKDCDGIKAGDTLPIKLGVDIQSHQINGYFEIEGFEVSSIVGENAIALKYSYPNPDDLTSTLALESLGNANMTGVLREPGLKADEPGCNFTQTKIVADQTSSGDDANPLFQKMAADFQYRRTTYTAKKRDPQGYAESERIGIAAAKGETKGSENPAAALNLREQLQPFYDKLYGTEDVRSLGNLILRAKLLEQLNKPEEALPLRERTLRIAKKNFPAKIASMAYALGNTLEILNRTELALDAFSTAVLADENQYGADHTEVASDLVRQARLFEALQRQPEAIAIYRRILAIREKTSSTSEEDLDLSHDNLARAQAPDAYTQLTQLAEQLTQANTVKNLPRAIEIRQKMMPLAEQLYGNPSRYLANLLYGQADNLESLNRDKEALELYPRTLKMMEVCYGQAHPKTANTVNNFAYQYKKMGRYAEAEPLYVRALAISEKANGPEHPSTGTRLNNLALLYDSMGQYARAEPLYVRALAISEKAEGPEHPSTGTSLNNLAELYRSMGQYARAEPLYVRALAISEKAEGPEHPSMGTSLNNLALLYGSQQKANEALPLFKRASLITDHHIANTFPILTEQQKLKFVEMKEGEMYGMLSLIHRQLSTNPEAIRSGLNLVLSRKGMVFDAQARQQDAIARSLDPETKKLWDALSSQRGELAKLMQNKPEKMSGEDYQKRIADSQTTITKLEGQIASKSALVAQDLKQRTITTKEVAKTLGKDGVLAEFVKIKDYDWEHGKWSATWRYLAFVLHGDGKIQLVDLGEAGALETTVQAALKPIGIVGSGYDQQQDATRILHQALWQPIAAAVGDANKVVFSPDGLLNLVPFAAMQDAGGHYLIENRQVSYVTSGRDLTKGDLGIKPETELYLAANPTFDLVAQANPASVGEEPTRGAVRSASFGMHFSPLPGTAKEAEQIPNYLKGKHTVLTGKDATEDSVLNTRRPRVMHLSTHGFFLADQAAITQGTRGASRIESDQAQAHNSANASALPQGYENPLVRSGLAFAGANHAGDAKGGRDGLLTALEVSGMDLHGTDLVTLSACETGRGEVKSGEGVFGLRRAFALAGTAHLMMSLWPVSDDVTAQQMQSFYRLYGKKTNPAAALRQAQLATIAELRSKRGQAEPALWAPFIVQGW
jgi:CHAT domain-containing protein